MIKCSLRRLFYVCGVVPVVFGSQTHFFDLTLTSDQQGTLLDYAAIPNRMKRRVDQLVPYLSFRNNILTIPGYRFAEVSTFTYLLMITTIKSSYSLQNLPSPGLRLRLFSRP